MNPRWVGCDEKHERGDLWRDATPRWPWALRVFVRVMFLLLAARVKVMGSYVGGWAAGVQSNAIKDVWKESPALSKSSSAGAARYKHAGQNGSKPTQSQHTEQYTLFPMVTLLGCYLFYKKYINIYYFMAVHDGIYLLFFGHNLAVFCVIYALFQIIAAGSAIPEIYATITQKK